MRIIGLASSNNPTLVPMIFGSLVMTLASFPNAKAGQLRNRTSSAPGLGFCSAMTLTV
jgi:hypothetical protein